MQLYMGCIVFYMHPSVYTLYTVPTTRTSAGLEECNFEELVEAAVVMICMPQIPFGSYTSGQKQQLFCNNKCPDGSQTTINHRITGSQIEHRVDEFPFLFYDDE